MQIQKESKLYAALYSAAVLILFYYAVAPRILWLFSKDFPNATDSFYYLQELKNRLLTGEGYYVKHSTFFSFWSFIGKIFSLTPFETHNLIFVSSLSIFCIASLLYLNSGVSIYVICIYICTYLLSDVLFYRHYAFLKQGFSVSVLFLGLSTVLNFKNNKSLTLIGLCLLLYSATMHIFTAAIALIVLCKIFITRTNIKPVIITAVFFCGFLVTYFFLTDLRAVFEFNLFNLAGWAKAGWWYSCSLIKCSEYEKYEYALYSLVLLTLLANDSFLKNYKSSEIFYPLSILCLILNAPVWSSEGHMFDRLAMSSTWIFYILFADLLKSKHYFYKLCLFLVCAILIYCSNTRVKLPYNAERVPYNDLEKNAEYIKKWIPEGSFILAEHGVEFIVTYFLDRKSASSLPKNETALKYYQVQYNNNGLYTDECILASQIESQPDARCVKINDKMSIYSLNMQL